MAWFERGRGFSDRGWFQTGLGATQAEGLTLAEKLAMAREAEAASNPTIDALPGMQAGPTGTPAPAMTAVATTFHPGASCSQIKTDCGAGKVPTWTGSAWGCVTAQKPTCGPGFTQAWGSGRWYCKPNTGTTTRLPSCAPGKVPWYNATTKSWSCQTLDARYPVCGCNTTRVWSNDHFVCKPTYTVTGCPSGKIWSYTTTSCVTAPTTTATARVSGGTTAITKTVMAPIKKVVDIVFGRTSAPASDGAAAPPVQCPNGTKWDATKGACVWASVSGDSGAQFRDTSAQDTVAAVIDGTTDVYPATAPDWVDPGLVIDTPIVEEAGILTAIPFKHILIGLGVGVAGYFGYRWYQNRKA